MRLFALGVQLLLHSIAARALGAPELQFHREEEVQLMNKLAASLSEDATVTLPWSSEWGNLTLRASTPRISPNYIATVEVATEADVQHVIKFANEFGLPFLAVSGAHGWASTLDNVHWGIQINMRKLNKTNINDGGETATFGGGSLQHEITAALFAEGKRAVTGLCECVSGIGPLLGGGHSLLQGLYGFSADNLVSARLVLADGSAVTVSETENSDLFWAIRGAGHNFAVVTSYELKLYDLPEAGWTMAAFSYTQDKLEAFFDTWNQLEEDNDDTGSVVLNGVMVRNNDVDPDHAVISLQILSEDNDAAAGVYATAFRAIGPVFDETTTGISWNELFSVGGFGLDSPVCRKNENIAGFPNSFATWYTDGMRHGHTVFTNMTSDETYASSAWLLESYGRKGVTDVDEAANAVAPEERRRHLLTSPMIWWKGDDEADAETALEWGDRMQKAIRAPDDEPHSYVNYSPGGEPLGQTYGRDTERLQKLKGLKAKWDPENRFGFYNPIQ